jgi:hypothetical protein
VVVVVEAIGGGVVLVVCSVVVVLVTFSELPQPATRIVPAKSATTVKNRKWDVVLVMGCLRIRKF